MIWRPVHVQARKYLGVFAIMSEALLFIAPKDGSLIQKVFQIIKQERFKPLLQNFLLMPLQLQAESLEMEMAHQIVSLEGVELLMGLARLFQDSHLKLSLV